MSSLFADIYYYFKERKIVLFSLLLLGVVSSIYLSSQIKLEEDISKIMPADQKLNSLNDLLEGTKIADRIALRIKAIDSTTSTPDQLVAFASTFIQRFTSQVDSHLYDKLTYKIDEYQLTNFFASVQTNLPFLLNEADYTAIENRTHPDSITGLVRSIYKSLLIPGSTYIKKFVFSDPIGMTGLVFNRIQEFQLEDQIVLHNGHFITADKQNLLLFIDPNQSGKETRINSDLIASLDRVIAQTKRSETKADIIYFGGPAVAVANAKQIRKDVTRTVTIALFVLFGLMIYFFRSTSVFIYLTIPTVLGALFALAVLSIFRPQLSIVALGIGSVLLGITLDYSLHVVTHYRSTDNIRLLLSDVTRPILISSLTTAIAFLCLFFIRSEALRDMGLFAALSVFFSSLLSLLVLPHLLKKPKSSVPNPSNTFIHRIAKFGIKSPRFAIFFIVFITLFSLFYAGKTGFEDDLAKVNFMPSDLVMAESELNQLTSSTKRGVFLMSSGSNLNQALANGNQLISLLDSLKDQNLISNYTSVASFLPDSSTQVRRLTRWNNYWTQKKKTNLIKRLHSAADDNGFRPDVFASFGDILSADYRSINKTTLKQLIDGLFAELISVNENRSSVMTVVRINESGVQPIYTSIGESNRAAILDKGYLIAQFVDILRVDFGRLVLWSFIFVFIFLHLTYGRIEIPILTITPIVIGWLWTLAFMWLFDLKFNIINIIITTFIFGLGVDYSVFVTRGLLQEHEDGVKNLISYKTSIILSAITTLVGIGVLITAKHPALRSIAAISIIGIVNVIFLVFVLQPILFRWLFYRSDGEQRPYPLTLSNTFKTLAVYFGLILSSVITTILGCFIWMIFFISKAKRKRLFHSVIYRFGRLFTRIGLFPHQMIINITNEDFTRPAVIIANHASHIDSPILLGLSPNLILLTKPRVFNSPLYHVICKLADYYNVGQGIESLLPKIRRQCQQGYSVALFPEGSRSDTDAINRFRKGAFLLADDMGVDILPVYIHGTQRYLGKTNFWGQSNDITITIGSRISLNNELRNGDIGQQTRSIGHYFKTNFEAHRQQLETPYYFRRQLLENYRYKGAILTFYLPVKLRLENYYVLFDKYIPSDAHIIDIGCGYGFMSYMLLLRGPNRQIVGIDYDEEKIALARHCQLKNESIDFIACDITNFELPKSNVFILADILHYLPEEDQSQLFTRLARSLTIEGLIIIRDGDRDVDNGHGNTRLTEFFSTKFNFNKTKNKLHFISSTLLKQWATKESLTMECVERSTKTSNRVFIFRHQSRQASMPIDLDKLQPKSSE